MTTQLARNREWVNLPTGSLYPTVLSWPSAVTLTIPTALPTWLGPVVEACVAVVVVEGTERLWAEHAVTLQILAHVLQEPQHRRRAGGSRQLHVADAVFGTHCKTKQQWASGCVQCVQTHKHTEYTFTAKDKEQMVWGCAPSPFQVHIFHPISHCCTLPSHPSQACTNPQINTPPRTSPILSYSLHNLPPWGKPNPSVPNQVRRKCHFWLQTQCSHQLPRQALPFIVLLRSVSHERVPLNQFHLHDCLFMIHGVCK